MAENLVLRLIAKTDSLEKGLNQTSRKLARVEKSFYKSRNASRAFGTSLSGIGRKLIGFASAALAAGGVGGLGFLIKKQMESIDLTAKWSDRLGVGTDKLVGLQHAGSLAGVKLKVVNLALQRMTRRVAEVAMGTGEAQAALKELGIDAVAANAAGAHESFSQIAEALSKVKNQSDRVRLAFKIFDSSGVAVVNMMKDGRAGLQGMQADAEALGMTFSRFEAGQVEAANDAIARMKQALQGVARVAAIKLAPVIKILSDSITDAMTAGEGFGRGMITTMVSVAKATLKVVDAVETAARVMRTLSGHVGETADEEIARIYKSKVPGDAKFGTPRMPLKPDQSYLHNLAVGGSNNFKGLEAFGTDIQEKGSFGPEDQGIFDETTVEVNNRREDSSGMELLALDTMGDKLLKGISALNAKRVAEGKSYQEELDAVMSRKVDSDGPLIKDSKAADAADKLTQSLQQQIRAMELVSSGKAKNVAESMFMLKAEEAYGAGTTLATEAINSYVSALDQVEGAKKRAAGLERTALILDGMDREIDLIGKVGNAWERSREFAELHAAAIDATSGNLEEYNAIMLRAEVSFKKARMAEQWAEVANTMETSFTTAFERMAFEGQKFGDTMKQMLQEVLKEIIRIQAIRPMAKATSNLISAGITGLMGGIAGLGGGAAAASGGSLAGAGTPMNPGLVLHRGGTVGSISTPKRMVPAGTFTGAPKFHDGLKVDEFPAILQKGEQVIPRGGGNKEPSRATPPSGLPAPPPMSIAIPEMPVPQPASIAIPEMPAPPPMSIVMPEMPDPPPMSIVMPKMPAMSEPSKSAGDIARAITRPPAGDREPPRGGSRGFISTPLAVGPSIHTPARPIATPAKAITGDGIPTAPMAAAAAPTAAQTIQAAQQGSSGKSGRSEPIVVTINTVNKGAPQQTDARASIAKNGDLIISIINNDVDQNGRTRQTIRREASSV